jgi:hypothetical protein
MIDETTPAGVRCTLTACALSKVPEGRATTVSPASAPGTSSAVQCSPSLMELTSVLKCRKMGRVAPGRSEAGAQAARPASSR